MSSIYRKGRDGYFYYQTYIKNPETGKKDKRIFHSLGTKDELEAVKQKVVLDKEYEKKSKIETKPLLRTFKVKIFSISFLIVVVLFFIWDVTRNIEIRFSENIKSEKKKGEIIVESNINLANLDSSSNKIPSETAEKLHSTIDIVKDDVIK